MDEIPGFWAGAQDHAGGVDVIELADRVGGLRALREGGEDALVAAGLTPTKARAWATTRPRTTRGVALCVDDPRFPARVREVKGGPPPVLCVQGDVEALSADAVAMVGTRRCTGYGVAIARQLAGGIAATGVIVVSGLARGIDSHAHKGALLAGRTVAVLGHGLAHTAPASNRPLRDAIVDGGGAVVSVWPDGFEPRPYTFPLRNAWISALSKAVVVVEAPRSSGALITAKYAGEQGRDVYAVPGPLGAISSQGCLELIGQGAACVWDVEALISLLTQRSRAPAAEWLQQLFLGATIDDAARVAGRSTAEILAQLGLLELQGQVVRLPGQRYAPGGSPR